MQHGHDCSGSVATDTEHLGSSAGSEGFADYGRAKPASAGFGQRAWTGAEQLRMVFYRLMML
jgi:hypothetical protein